MPSIKIAYRHVNWGHGSRFSCVPFFLLFVYPPQPQPLLAHFNNQTIQSKIQQAYQYIYNYTCLVTMSFTYSDIDRVKPLFTGLMQTNDPPLKDDPWVISLCRELTQVHYST